MKYLKSLIISLLSVFAPLKPVVIATLILVAVDLMTGMLAAWKRGEALTSAGLRRTISKVFVYEAALLLGFLTEHYFTGSSVPVSKIVSSFVGCTELLSCLENLNEVSSGSLLNALICKLQSQNYITPRKTSNGPNVKP